MDDDENFGIPLVPKNPHDENKSKYKMTNIGNKILDGAKYVGKNFWKVLPFGSLINYLNKEATLKQTAFKRVGLHLVYGIIGTIGIAGALSECESTSDKDKTSEPKTEKISYDDSEWNAYTGFNQNSTKLDTAKFLSDNCLEGKIHFDEITKQEKQLILAGRNLAGKCGEKYFKKETKKDETKDYSKSDNEKIKEDYSKKDIKKDYQKKKDASGNEQRETDKKQQGEINKLREAYEKEKREAGSKDVKDDYKIEERNKSKSNSDLKGNNKSGNKNGDKTSSSQKSKYILKEMPGWVNPKTQEEFDTLMKIYENASNVTKEGCCETHTGWPWKNGAKATSLNVFDGDTFIGIRDGFEQANKRDLIKPSNNCNSKEFKAQVYTIKEFLELQGLKGEK